jgi:hypothetical protein
MTWKRNSTTRKAGLKLPDSKLAQAARWNDAMTEEQGLPAACEHLGVDLDTLMHLAEQRAMRLHMIQTGRFAELQALARTNEPKAVRLSRADRLAITTLMPAYLDGILIGHRAAQQED